MGEIVEIFQIATQIIRIAVPNEEKDEILIMAKVFANTLAIYLAFLEISQMYRPVAANINIRSCPYRNFPNFFV